MFQVTNRKSTYDFLSVIKSNIFFEVIEAYSIFDLERSSKTFSRSQRESPHDFLWDIHSDNIIICHHFVVMIAYSISDLERSSRSFSRSPTESWHMTSNESSKVTTSSPVIVFKLQRDIQYLTFKGHFQGHNRKLTYDFVWVINRNNIIICHHIEVIKAYSIFDLERPSRSFSRSPTGSPYMTS